MLNPVFELKYISEEEGLGVVATRFVPKGTMTSIESDLDMVLTPVQMEQLDSSHQELIKKYGYRKPTGEFFLDWDHARFINHSFHNTEVFTTYEFGLAVRDIQPGEQLTVDYGFMNYPKSFDPRPEAGSERSAVASDDLLKHHKRWDKQIAESFRHFNDVEQPLLKYVRPHFRQKVKAVAAGHEHPDSIVERHFSDAASGDAASEKRHEGPRFERLPS